MLMNPAMSVCHRFTQKRRAFGDYPVSLSKPGDDLNLISVCGSGLDVAQVVLAGRCWNVDSGRVADVKDRRERDDDARLRRLGDAYGCKHCRLEPMPRIREHHAHFDSVSGRIERISYVRYGSVERFIWIRGKEDIHAHVWMHRAQVAFEQISGYPYCVQIGDRGDSVCGFE